MAASVSFGDDEGGGDNYRHQRDAAGRRGAGAVDRVHDHGAGDRGKHAGASRFAADGAAFDSSADQLPLNFYLKHESDGSIATYWNDQKLKGEDEFRGRLAELHPSKDQEVSISADKDIAYDNVVHLMDMLAAVGIHKISLPTKHVGGK